MTATCKTCGGEVPNHVPSPLDPTGIGDPAHVTPTPVNRTIEQILDWHNRAVTEAMFKVIGEGKPIKIVITEELTNRHKAEAVAALEEMLLTSRLAVVQLILNTCKYEGRELYLSTTAVESLLKDLKSGSDKTKVFTALSRLEATLTKSKGSTS